MSVQGKREAAGLELPPSLSSPHVPALTIHSHRAGSGVSPVGSLLCGSHGPPRHTHTCTLTLTCTHPCTQVYARSHTHPHFHILTHTPSHTLVLTPTLPHFLRLSHTLTGRRFLAHLHSQTLTHMPWILTHTVSTHTDLHLIQRTPTHLLPRSPPLLCSHWLHLWPWASH